MSRNAGSTPPGGDDVKLPHLPLDADGADRYRLFAWGNALEELTASYLSSVGAPDRVS